MSLFFSYLKQQLKYILLFLLFSITFAITFFFYNFPLEALTYPTLLCVCFGLFFFIWIPVGHWFSVRIIAVWITCFYEIHPVIATSFWKDRNAAQQRVSSISPVFQRKTINLQNGRFRHYPILEYLDQTCNNSRAFFHLHFFYLKKDT